MAEWEVGEETGILFFLTTDNIIELLWENSQFLAEVS